MAGIEARENMPPYPHPEFLRVVSEVLVECGDSDHASQDDAQLIHKIDDKVNSLNLLESL
ncbi:hypothetical protein GCM10010520_64310 [Rhizobium viscosum]